MLHQLRTCCGQGYLGGDLPRANPLVGPNVLRISLASHGRTRDALWLKNKFRATSVAVKSPTETHSVSLWSGSDEFSKFNDRIDAPPLPLPLLTEPVRVVIVRHGQSTWNAEGRIQGSTDLSVLTEKGVKQAEKTRDMLSTTRFTRVFQSPLARARQTADVVMQGQVRPSGAACGATDERVTLPSLREIDLYQFQGLLKHEGKALYGEQYKRWQRAPHTFELDGHAPVRELWHRASVAWQHLLQPEEGAVQAQASDPRVVLVVAHNAINQALVGTALGLPPLYFRRLPQNNAALSIFDLAPRKPNGGSSSSPPLVTLSCLNQSPDNPFKNPDKVIAHVVLLTPPSHGSADTGGGEVPAKELKSLAAVLSKLQVNHVLACPGVHYATVAALLERQQPSAAAAAAAAAAGANRPLTPPVEFLPPSQPAGALWDQALAAAATPPSTYGDSRPSYGNVLVVLDEQRHAEVVWAALGLDGGAAGGGAPQLRVSPGGLSVIEFAADPRVTPATVRCINNTAHVSSSGPKAH